MKITAANYHIIPVILILFLSSCGASVGISKKEIRPFVKNYHGVFENKPARTKVKYNTIKEIDYQYSIMDHFDTGRLKLSPQNILVEITSDENLKLTFSNHDKIDSLLFRGKIKKNGIYEIYFKNDHLKIPPIVPFILSRVNVYRLRLAVSKNQELIISHKGVIAGSILILVDGEAHLFKNYYRKVSKLK